MGTWGNIILYTKNIFRNVSILYILNASPLSLYTYTRYTLSYLVCAFYCTIDIAHRIFSLHILYDETF